MRCFHDRVGEEDRGALRDRQLRTAMPNDRRRIPDDRAALEITSRPPLGRGAMFRGRPDPNCAGTPAPHGQTNLHQRSSHRGP